MTAGIADVCMKITPYHEAAYGVTKLLMSHSKKHKNQSCSLLEFPFSSINIEIQGNVYFGEEVV